MHSTAYTSVGLSASDTEISRRAELQGIRRILEPKDDEARRRWHAAKEAMQ